MTHEYHTLYPLVSRYLYFKQLWWRNSVVNRINKRVRMVRDPLTPLLPLSPFVIRFVEIHINFSQTLFIINLYSS
jgi:hypothetical protein